MTAHAISRDIAPANSSTSQIETMRQAYEAQRAAYLSHAPPDAATRRLHLQKLLRLVLDNEKAIIDSISADFGHRSPTETRMAELMPTAISARGAIKHVAKWMRPDRRLPHLAFLPSSAKLIPQPAGVVGIISPWNYPVILTLEPLIAALAAGNRVMIKTSEYSENFTALLQELIAKAYDPEHVTVVSGGPEVASAFSSLPFDHLLFTGSTNVGRLVMRAASENLTPVTLELGGKSPTVIGSRHDVKEAAEGISFGKFLNAGQTCVAPDYVMVPESKRDDFVAAMKATASTFYPTIEENDDFTSIINERHYRRLQSYLDDAKAKGATLVRLTGDGEPEDESKRRMRPTIVLDVTDDMKIMQDEIFGPLLPVRTYRSFDETISYINDHPRPLAAYLFSNDGSERKRFAERTISGGLCFNTCTIHVGVDELPFGGVGASGMGAYHGYEGFLTFSHNKPVFEQRKPMTAKLVFPPYGKLANRVVDFFKGR